MSSIFTISKIYKAYNECKKGKTNTHNALTFEMDREKNLLALLHDLQTGEYKVSRYVYFIAVYPTPREIFAADFRDRIVHHLLYNEIYTMFDVTFVPQSYANRVGKGTHGAVSELRKNVRHVKHESGGGWSLKLDVQSFFRSINKEILYSLMEKKIVGSSAGGGASEWFREILWLTRIIIFHKPTKNFIYKGDPVLQKLILKSKSLFYSGNNGLPIGNLTSQFFANVYLNELDHFIIEKLNVISYVRYVDDFIIIDHDPQKLKSFVPVINEFLKSRLGLTIHPRKIHFQQLDKGIDFLGYFIKSSHILVRQKVVKRFKRRLYFMDKTQKISDGTIKNILPMINSYYGHFRHANSFNLIKNINSKYFIKFKSLFSS